MCEGVVAIEVGLLTGGAGAALLGGGGVLAVGAGTVVGSGAGLATGAVGDVGSTLTGESGAFRYGVAGMLQEARDAGVEDALHLAVAAIQGALTGVLDAFRVMVLSTGDLAVLLARMQMPETRGAAVAELVMSIEEFRRVPRLLWERRGAFAESFARLPPEKQANVIGQIVGQLEFVIATTLAAGKIPGPLAALGKSGGSAPGGLGAPVPILAGATGGGAVVGGEAVGVAEALAGLAAESKAALGALGTIVAVGAQGCGGRAEAGGRARR